MEPHPKDEDRNSDSDNTENLETGIDAEQTAQDDAMRDMAYELSTEDDDPLAPTENADSIANQQVIALQEQLDQAKDQMMRAVAEAENTRKRMMKEREDGRKYAISDFAKSLLDFSDNFGRALASIPPEAKEANELMNNIITGIEAMEKDLIRTFEKHGITKIEPLDDVFDPNMHEVMFETPTPGKAGGTIIQVIEPGYVLHDRLLRPARVGIAKDESHGGGQVDTEV